MLVEDDSAIARQYIQPFNQGEIDAPGEVMAPDLVDHYRGADVPHRLEGLKQTLMFVRSAFPDFRLSVQGAVCNEDNYTVSYTFWGPVAEGLRESTISSRGRQVTVEGINLVRVQDGKIIEEHADFDILGVLQQIGIISVPAGVATRHQKSEAH